MKASSKYINNASFWSSVSSSLVLLLGVPLIVIAFLVYISGPDSTSSWSLSSPPTWRVALMSSESLASSSLTESSYGNSVFNSTNSPEENIAALSSLGDEEEKSKNEKDDKKVENYYKEISNIIESNATSATSIVKRYSKLERLEANLARARNAIREATLVKNLTSIHQDPDYVPRGPIYRNANAFHRSYLEMEKLFKIYVYEEGEPPMFHNGPCKSIYSTEGRFIHEMEIGNVYRTRNPEEALVYFLPFSVVMMVQYLYAPRAVDTNAIGRAVEDYIRIISEKHPFWNRSLGADHFMLSCHDWGPRASFYVPQLFHNSIRVLCNANTSEGFKPSKDVSFPEIHLRTGHTTGLLGGLSPSRRSILAFFAGRLHGHIRYLLLKQWKDKDSDVQVYDQLPEDVSYDSMLKKSKFCLCPSGYEVASPRVVEAIYAECVPVLISDSYVPPFSDVLNWKSFSVQIQVKDIPKIKEILKGISQGQYLRMQRRVKQVQRHFVVNRPPERFDIFHMTLHSVWLRRLNIRIQE